jgi:hypothetical protein
MTKIKAAGDSWSARIGESPADPEKQTVVFFCVTNGQRPYRVVEVPRRQLESQEALESLSGEELKALFDASVSMDFPRSYS